MTQNIKNNSDLSQKFLSRRDFLKLSLLTPAIGGMGWWNTPTIYKQTIKLEDIPSPFKGLKIAFVTDLHHGLFLSSETVHQIVEQIAQARPDLVLLGGDYVYIDKSFIYRSYGKMKNWEYKGLTRIAEKEAIFKTVVDAFRKLTPRLGTFAVYGNHDHWEGSSICHNAFLGTPIALLKNQTTELRFHGSKLELIGIDDYWTGIPKLPDLPEKKDSDSLRIILSHNPDFLSLLDRSSSFRYDLALCGHTHGGQIKLPVFGPLFVNILDQRLSEGLFQLQNGKVYTSRGIGTVELPVRINSDPEISLLELA